MSLTRLFKEHPASVDETYFEHMGAALSFSFTMIRAAICCAVHAFLPFLFTKTGSRAIEDLSHRMSRGGRVPLGDAGATHGATHRTA